MGRRGVNPRASDEASRLLGERDAMPTAQRRRFAKATWNGRMLDDARERDIQRAALLEGRRSRQGFGLVMTRCLVGCLMSILGYGERSGPGIISAGYVLILAPYFLWQIWRQRELGRPLGTTPESVLT